MQPILGLLKKIAPLVADTDPKGWWKASIGRFLLLLVVGVGSYMYVAKQMDFGVGICAVIASLLSYNGFSKTPTAQGNGGFATVAPPVVTPAAPAAPGAAKDSD